MGATLNSNLPEIRRNARLAARAVVIKTVADIKANAQANCPVDTGQLRASIYGRTESELSGRVFTGTDYAEYVEYGTTRAAAQPFLLPAAETVRPAFEAAMAQIVTGAAVTAGGHSGVTSLALGASAGLWTQPSMPLLWEGDQA